MKPIDVSVIVPVYNAEKYIGECIESIMRQTFKNFELILIDDGSTDTSYEICRAYQQKYPGIHLNKKENGGSSSARNAGLKIAAGKYICFVDADDFLESSMLEVMNHTAEKYNADLTVCNYFVHTKKKVIKGHNIQEQIIMKSTKDEIDRVQVHFLCKGLKDFKPHVFSGFPWGRLYKKSVIDEFHLLFPEEVQRTEDGIFNLYFMQHCQCLVYNNTALYNYRILDSSISHNYNPKIIEITEKDFEALNEFCRRHKENDPLFNGGVKIRICTWFQLYLSMYYFSEKYINDEGYFSARKEIISLLEKPIYKNAYSGVKYHYMRNSEKIFVFLMKHRLILLTYCGIILRREYKRIRGMN